MAKQKSTTKSKRAPLGIALALGNHKGGVGKSTNAVHIAAGLGLKGYQCLIIDLDPTAGSTKLVGVNTEDYAGTLEMLTENEPPSSYVLTEGLPEGVSIIPARTELASIDSMLKRYTDKLRLLKTPLDELRGSYDYIIVDTPPQPGSTLLAASYAAVEWFMLSVHPEPLAVGGLSETLRDIAEVRLSLNRELEIMGVVIGRVKRNSGYWKEIADFIEERLPGRGFGVQLSDTVELQRLSAEGITVFQHKKLAKHKITREYEKLVLEIEERTLNREEFLRNNKPKAKAAVGA